ncbi:MAG TPA: hypothetical protein DEB70_13160 [Planctomycetaceae bacterium]|nr:hypothetical protein [Planctomycetaceae bacterium]
MTAVAWRAGHFHAPYTTAKLLFLYSQEPAMQSSDFEPGTYRLGQGFHSESPSIPASIGGSQAVPL